MASYLVTVAIGPYKKYTQDGPHDLPLTYWVPKGKSELLKPLEKTPDALAWLEKRLGPYPFARAGVVVTPGEGSVETQTLTTFATGNYRYGNADVREQVAHDLAHAWYGDTVTPNDWRDVWMSEGMATYLQAKFAVAQGLGHLGVLEARVRPQRPVLARHLRPARRLRPATSSASATCTTAAP